MILLAPSAQLSSPRHEPRNLMRSRPNLAPSGLLPHRHVLAVHQPVVAGVAHPLLVESPLVADALHPEARVQLVVGELALASRSQIHRHAATVECVSVPVAHG